MWTIFLILAAMWMLGIATANTLGGYIHILLLLALISFAIRQIRARPLTSYSIPRKRRAAAPRALPPATLSYLSR